MRAQDVVGDPAIRPPAGTTGTLGWIDFLLAFIGAPVSFLVVLVYAVVASPMTRADPGLLEAGLRSVHTILPALLPGVVLLGVRL